MEKAFNGRAGSAVVLGRPLGLLSIAVVRCSRALSFDRNATVLLGAGAVHLQPGSCVYCGGLVLMKSSPILSGITVMQRPSAGLRLV